MKRARSLDELTLTEVKDQLQECQFLQQVEDWFKGYDKAADWRPEVWPWKSQVKERLEKFIYQVQSIETKLTAMQERQTEGDVEFQKIVDRIEEDFNVFVFQSREINEIKRIYLLELAEYIYDLNCRQINLTFGVQ